MSGKSLPEHPRLLFNRQGIEALKARIERCDWAQKRWRVVLQNGEGWLKEAAALPEGRKHLLALNPQGTPVQLETPGGSKWRMEGYFGIR